MGANPLRGQIHYKGNWKRWATENQDFFGPEMATSETHEHKITNVLFIYGAWTFVE
jgi:hypothetical protein